MGHVDDDSEVRLEPVGRSCARRASRSPPAPRPPRRPGRPAPPRLADAAGDLERDVRRPGGCRARARRAGRRASSTGSVVDHDRVATRVPACAPPRRSRTPTSTCSAVELDGLLALVCPRARGPACARRRRAPGAERVSTSTRWPTRICGSQPPVWMKCRKPLSLDVGDRSPISSMWPMTASSGVVGAAVDAGDRRCRPGRGPRRRRTPGRPRARRRRGPFVAGRARGGQQSVQ